METEGITKAGTDSQDSHELPGSSKLDTNKSTINIPIPQTSISKPQKLKPSSKGVENAKKRLRAFSIQKKTPITPISVNKPVVANKTSISGSGSTVFIGKLSGVKTTQKTEDAEQKKLLKPPKPGQGKKATQDSYVELQKRTLSEIEDMKRKMELVELGIPLGLICPTADKEKAMPTKAMPPIKSLLDPAKVNEIIRDAKLAKAQGKEFKFDYQKLLPDYDNPFQRKKEEPEDSQKSEQEFYKKADRDKRKGERYDRDPRLARHFFHRKDVRDRWKDDQERYRERSKDQESKREVRTDPNKYSERETDVNLSDYLVCDSWSLETEDKTSSLSPKRQEIQGVQPDEQKACASNELSTEPAKGKILKKELRASLDSPKSTPTKMLKKLQPVMDSFKFEIDPVEDEITNISDQNSGSEVYSKSPQKKEVYDAPFDKVFDANQSSKDAANDALTDDTFLESVINEIKQESMSDDDEICQDKGLVEYDSPTGDSPNSKETRSVTPELDDRMREVQSSRSDYSDGYRSTESGYKSTESGYKSNSSYKSDKSENYRMSMENELVKMPKSTVESLETWSFVLKICQPLLFRHDRNKCYRETRSHPKIWYAENPKLCTCVKDRTIVYEELETCKMGLVDRVYGCDQIPESQIPETRGWYPRFAQCLVETNNVTAVAPSTEWEVDDSQTETPQVKDKTNSFKTTRSTTPLRSEEIYLDREYQRFMEAVWPEVSETKSATPRSTTPVKQEVRKKKAEDTQQQDDKKKAKKIKLSSEGWSQESDIEEDAEKTKKVNKIQKVEKVKVRKRRRSSTLSDTDSNSKRQRKASKKANKKTKSKLMKRRRLSKKYLKKLKDKEKKKKKHVSEDEDIDKANRKKEKKLKKKKLQKKKKAQKKKKSKAKLSSSSSSSSSTSSSETSTDSDSEEQIKKKRKKSGVKSKKRKQSTSESPQSEDLFDVNVLNNIKTERLTDDENKLEFSPRRQKPREIINVKELQNDFVGSVQIKKEVEDKEIAEKQKIQELELVIQREEEKPTTEIVPESITESNSQSVADNVCQENGVCRKEVETVSQSAAETVSNSLKESISHSVTERVIQSPEESVSRHVTESVSQSPKESVSRHATEIVSQSPKESVSRHVTESVSQSSKEIVSRHATEIVSQSPKESVSRHLTESVSQNSKESVSQHATEIVSQSPKESVSRHVTESVSQSSKESVSRHVTESVSQSSKESVSRHATESVSQSSKESVSRHVTESVSQSSKESVSRHATESVSQSSNESVSRLVTETVSQSAKESVSQHVTESVSPSSKEIAKEIISHSITKKVSHNIIESIPRVLAESVSKKVPDVITYSIPKSRIDVIPVLKHELHITQLKERLDANRSTPQEGTEVNQPEELSQCSSQESTVSKDPYEKDDSHLRPSSQNSNYSFNDVISASQNYQKEEEDKFEQEGYEEGNYEMYEQLAMAYQSDVAKQWGGGAGEWRGSQRIETVVRMRARGEIKCDWRADAGAAPAPPRAAVLRPSRWGLKPGEVNIVLTGGNSEVYPIQNVVEPVYQIETLANNRADNSSTGSYDEAYEDMYGASDRLQYGDCFATEVPEPEAPTTPSEPKKPPAKSSLDDRITQVLKAAALKEAAKVSEEAEADKDGPEKSKLLTKSTRGAKRVSFADGYKPGQDSDVEEPPRKKKKARRVGCAWPCPASHPDHVPLWDALPPPPPPPGSPPPPFPLQPTNMLPQMLMHQPPPMMQQPPSMMQQPPSMMQQPPPMMQQPPSMMQQQPPQMMQQQPPQMMQQQPPQRMQQQPPQMMQQQPPQMMPQPPPMIQQQLMQQQLLHQQGINPAMLQAPPFAMAQKMDPSVSLQNFMPPEPPPGLISF